MKRVKRTITASGYLSCRKDTTCGHVFGEYLRVGKISWIPVTVFQPEGPVAVANALLTPVARMDPALRKSCRETTTKPRKGAGTISDW
jgi:hypothetical protein